MNNNNNQYAAQSLAQSSYAGVAPSAPPMFPPGLIGTLDQTLVNLAEAVDRLGNIQYALGSSSGDSSPTAVTPAASTVVTRALEIQRQTERLLTALMHIQNAL